MGTPVKRQPLSRERVLGAALALVDREGLEAISMRRLGEELGVEAMSLYNHVASKTALLDGVFEAILGELPPAPRVKSWQATLRERARALRAALIAHPRALPLFATRPAVTPAAIRHVEEILDVLGQAGFSPGDALSTLNVLVAFVVGHALATHGPSRPEDQARPLYEQLADSEFPRVRAAARRLGSHDVAEEFGFGLDTLIAGLERRAKKRAP